MSRFKPILNRHEEAAFQELQGIASEYGYGVHVKVRLADVFAIEGSGIDSSLYSFALKSHFDFLVSDPQHNPIFAVEFDGPSHQDENQRARDARKNELCQRFELPLLRINSNHLLKRYNKASLLRWIVSAWELQKGFYEAQEQGAVPWDEDFDPVLLWHQGSTLEEKHPHWIALKPRLHIDKLYKAGRLPVPTTCQFTFLDENEKTHRGIEWIDVGDRRVVVVESAMREQQFPIYMGDLFGELMTVLLHDKLTDFLEAGHGSVDSSQVERRFVELKQRYKFASSHSGPTCVNARLRLLETGAWSSQMQAQECAYCGDPPTTKDHVPPRNIRRIAVEVDIKSGPTPRR